MEKGKDWNFTPQVVTFLEIRQLPLSQQQSLYCERVKQTALEISGIEGSAFV